MDPRLMRATPIIDVGAYKAALGVIPTRNIASGLWVRLVILDLLKVQANEIFKPQGVIIVQTNILQDQLQRILKQYQEFG
jgi:hypothetical protein